MHACHSAASCCATRAPVRRYTFRAARDVLAHDGHMRFPLLSPAALADLTRAAVGLLVDVAAAAAIFPVRVVSLLDQSKLVVNRVK